MEGQLGSGDSACVTRALARLLRQLLSGCAGTLGYRQRPLQERQDRAPLFSPGGFVEVHVRCARNEPELLWLSRRVEQQPRVRFRRVPVLDAADDEHWTPNLADMV